MKNDFWMVFRDNLIITEINEFHEWLWLTWKTKTKSLKYILSTIMKPRAFIALTFNVLHCLWRLLKFDHSAVTFFTDLSMICASMTALKQNCNVKTD